MEIEPAPSAVTGRCANCLRYRDLDLFPKLSLLVLRAANSIPVLLA
jgi:hypothetical protein